MLYFWHSNHIIINQNLLIMSNHQQQHDAMLLKGLASQILSMNLPSVVEVKKLIDASGIELLMPEKPSEKQYSESQVEKILEAVIICIDAKSDCASDKALYGGTYRDKVQNILLHNNVVAITKENLKSHESYITKTIHN